MQLLNRFRAAAQAFRAKDAPPISEQQQALWWRDTLGVDLRSYGDSLSEATYYACLKVLSEGVGKLPLKIQQASAGQGVRVAREHRMYRMLNERPNPHMAASVFWSTMEICRNHYGNAYAWIDTTDPRRPHLWPLDPASVQVVYDNAGLLSDAKDVFYRVSTPRGELVLPSEAVLHLKSHSTLDGLVGKPVREQLRDTIGGSIKSQRMLNRLYDGGMTAKCVLQYTGSLSDANVQQLVKGIEQYAKGDFQTNGLSQIIPIPLGFNLTPLNLKLADSQFLELRQYSALQIASAFGVKPYQIGDYSKSSYASAEAQQLSFLVDTLMYIVKQYEEEIAYKLLTDDEVAAGYHVKFNVAAMLRADQQTQINTLSAAVSNFLMTPNEARERLDLPAKDGGDRLLGNGASIPVQYTGAQYTTTREEDKQWITDTITETIRGLLRASSTSPQP